jgi:hypothetical protein
VSVDSGTECFMLTATTMVMAITCKRNTRTLQLCKTNWRAQFLGSVFVYLFNAFFMKFSAK